MIKPSYLVEPVNFNAPETELVIMISNEDIVITTRSNDRKPSYNGLWFFEIPAGKLTGEVFRNILESYPIFRHSFCKTNIILNTPRQFFVPTHLSDENTNRELMYMLQPLSTLEDAIITDNLGNVQSIFVVPMWFQKICNEKLYNLNIAHFHSLFFALSKPSKSYIDVWVQKDSITIKLVFENTVQTIKKCNYTNADDVVFNLLHISKLFNVPISELFVYISGFLENDSVLYRTISKYFKYVYIEGYDQNLKFKSNMFNVTPHFFSKFFEISQCV